MLSSMRYGTFQHASRDGVHYVSAMARSRASTLLQLGRCAGSAAQQSLHGSGRKMGVLGIIISCTSREIRCMYCAALRHVCLPFHLTA